MYRSQSVWRDLENGKFDYNEHGHIEFNVQDWSTEPSETTDNVDGLVVIFVDPVGFKTELGAIKKNVGSNYATVATAYAHSLDADGEPLMPTDPRWDVIVDTTGRAINTCQQEGKTSV